MIVITRKIAIRKSELRFSFVTAPGPGGQNVNKLATAAQLRFNVLHSSSLPDEVRKRLLSLLGPKVTTYGEVIIKASRYRTQERNKQDALDRLIALIKRAAIPLKKRRKTKPGLGAIQAGIKRKKEKAEKKYLRRKINM